MYREVAYFIYATDLQGTEDLKLSKITLENCKSKRGVDFGVCKCVCVCLCVGELGKVAMI